MRNCLLVVLLTCIIVGSLSDNVFALFKSTKFTIVVVNEVDEPLSGIRVGVGFEKNIGWGTDSSGQQGMTDADGRLTFTGQSNGHITYGGRNDRYYPSYYDYDFKDLGAFGWEPWNPELKTVMRKIEKPVPMYARNTQMSNRGIVIPVIGEDIGFDLIEYDWLPPYGKGKKTDFIFNLKSRFSGNRDYDFKIKIKFKEGDGIFKIKEDLDNGSVFHLPRYAPLDGYVNSLAIDVSRQPNGPSGIVEDKNTHYFFRVRSVVEDGKVVSAMYGKILRDIWINPLRDGRARVDFRYYLNPDGTRNLEFDPNRNLFKDLPSMERVGIK